MNVKKSKKATWKNKEAKKLMFYIEPETEELLEKLKATNIRSTFVNYAIKRAYRLLLKQKTNPFFDATALIDNKEEKNNE